MSSPAVPMFSPFTGGPLFRFERRHLGWEPALGRPAVVRVLAGLAIGWLPMLALAALQARHDPAALKQFFAERHLQAQLLVTIPVLLASEAYTHGRLEGAIPLLSSQGILAPAQLAPVDRTIRKLVRWRDSAWAPAIALIIGYLLVGARVVGHSAPAGAVLHTPLSLAGLWYTTIASPLSTLLLLLWLWRYLLWCVLLVRVSRLPLALVPTHADRTGGLRWLVRCQASFAPVVLAIGAIVATYQGPRRVDAGDELVAMAKGQVIYAVVALAVLHLPLVAFSSALLRAKRSSDESFPAVVAHHNRAFEQRWFRERNPTELLGVQDPSSQIDLTSAFEVAEKMRWLPYSLRSMIAIVAAAGAGLIPRLVFERRLLDVLIHLGEHFV